MAASKKLLEVARGLALKGQILAELGDAAGCLATALCKTRPEGRVNSSPSAANN
jgi:hypothetical protein